MRFQRSKVDAWFNGDNIENLKHTTQKISVKKYNSKDFRVSYPPEVNNTKKERTKC